MLGTNADPGVLTPRASDTLKGIINSLGPRQGVSFHEMFKEYPQAADLLSHLLVLNPAKRYTVEEALRHPFFVELHCPEDEPDFQGPPHVSYGGVASEKLNIQREFAFDLSAKSRNSIQAALREEIERYNPVDPRCYDRRMLFLLAGSNRVGEESLVHLSLFSSPLFSEKCVEAIFKFMPDGNVFQSEKKKKQRDGLERRHSV